MVCMRKSLLYFFLEGEHPTEYNQIFFLVIVYPLWDREERLRYPVLRMSTQIFWTTISSSDLWWFKKKYVKKKKTFKEQRRTKTNNFVWCITLVGKYQKESFKIILQYFYRFLNFIDSCFIFVTRFMIFLVDCYCIFFSYEKVWVFFLILRSLVIMICFIMMCVEHILIFCRMIQVSFQLFFNLIFSLRQCT